MILLRRKVDEADIGRLWSAFQTKHKNSLPKYKSASTEQLSWEKVKKVAKQEGNQTFLLAFGQLRKQIVDSLLALALAQSEAQSSPDSCSDCFAIAAGSVQPTSDYDVTVFGTMSALLTHNFYVTFRRLFKVEPVEMFDTNVYGGPTVFTLWPKSEFGESEHQLSTEQRVYNLLPKQQVLRAFDIGDKWLTTLQPTQEKSAVSFCDNSNSSNCVSNPTKLCSSSRCWAILSFLRFMHSPEDKQKTVGVLLQNNALIAPDLKKYLDLSSQLALDRQQFEKQPLNSTCVTMLAMCQQTNYYLALIKRSQETQSQLFDALQQFDVNAQAKKKAKTLRDILRNQVSHAALYGSEMYVTMGAILHVVVHRQMSVNQKIAPNLLLPDDLFDSFMENSGYAYHVMDDLTDADVSQTVLSQFDQVAVLKASKYLARALHALFLRDTLVESSLSAAYDSAEEARKKARNNLGTIDSKYAQRLATPILQFLGASPADKKEFLDQFVQWVAQQSVNFYNSTQ